VRLPVAPSLPRESQTQMQMQTQKRVESVIRREAPRLLAFFERRVPYTDAPDLLGEVLLVAWRRADALPVDEQAARMWLFGVARRVLSTTRRAGVRRQALVDRLRDEAESAGTDHQLEDEDLVAALSTLSALDAEIIRLLHWDGFTLAEVANHLGRPAGTIRSRYSRARGALRDTLQLRE
jgi:RNA polymerase sigma-70 factor (ECF subfamily)